MTRNAAFPQTVIRASAGTGKTYQLALRFIGLLMAGVKPDEILATTFTRKAAGEILDRVLSWLAKAADDDQQRQALAQALGLSALTRARCLELLQSTVRQLHTLRVGTLDSHFLRVATSFGLELGLPPGWTICDELTDALLREEAIEQVLSGRVADLLTLVHALTKGVTTRSVSRLASDTVGSLLELYRESLPEAWSRFPACKGLEAAECEQLSSEILALPIAEKRLAKARGEDVARFQAQAWDEFLSKGLVGKVQSGELKYYNHSLPPELIVRYRRLLQHVESIVVGQVARQTEATWQLLERFRERYERLQLEERVLRFSDITLRLAEAAEAVQPEQMAFRLDGGIRHVLLDEFQDTSPAQWRVLRPLAEMVCRQHGGSFFCVGDTKQAIYGWRGGVAAIFDAIGEQLPGLETSHLATSFRSSPVVIQGVNTVFQNLSDHPHLDKYEKSVQQWQRAFPEHTTARSDLSGYVSLATAPAANDGEQQGLVTLRHAARAVQEIVLAAPAARVGVLVRTNTAVAQMIFELRSLGIAASEEGGNPLVDSPAVELVLSLLKLADHPGDTVARFHLANSPLAGLLPLADHTDRGAAARLAKQLRRELLETGYGATLHAWCQRLAPSCDERDRARLQQLVELAFEYQPASTLRTSDFRKLVESRKVADPQAAAVRVMTIHQSKGLEFDVVVLPELEGRLVGQPDRVVAGRPSPTERVNLVCRLANEHVRQFLPDEFQQLFTNDTALEVSESLCVLYVAMTRAAHALHMIIAPARANERQLPKTFSGLLRATLASGVPATPERVLYELGTKSWMRGTSAAKAGTPPGATDKALDPARIGLAPPGERRERGLERASPSALEGGTSIAGAAVLTRRQLAGLGIGTLFHAWLEQVEWLDDGLPDERLLREVFQRVGGEVSTALPNMDEQLARFRKQVAAQAIAQGLSRSFYDNQGAGRGAQRLVVEREQPFALRQGNLILKGSIDRLVTIERDGRLVAADVIDFKTDELPDAADQAGLQAAVRQKVEFYRPQLEAYRAAAAWQLDLPAEQISARLMFLSAGIVHTL